MSRQDKTILKTIVTVLLSAGAIASAVLYVADIKQDVQANTIRFDEGRKKVDSLTIAIENIADSQRKQSDAIIRLQAYFDYGLVDRLKLDKDFINKQALLMSSTTP